MNRSPSLRPKDLFERSFLHLAHLNRVGFCGLLAWYHATLFTLVLEFLVLAI